MTTGALIFAHNNTDVDYTKLAVFAATRVIQYLNIPVTLVTDNKEWLLSKYPDHPFDQVIEIPPEASVKKLFYDGAVSSRQLEWKNLTRLQAYDLSPYDTTLVLDSDYIISSAVLKDALAREAPFQIYSNHFDLAPWRLSKQYTRISDYSIPFYWATVFIFKKDPVIKAFFDLIAYIKSNWTYFRYLHMIDSAVFRNDHAFSIAIHIMNGKTLGDFATELPGNMTFITDMDLLTGIKESALQFLVQKENHLGEYIATKTSSIDVHVMNKISLSRIIDE